jgi:hypothetical protein
MPLLKPLGKPGNLDGSRWHVIPSFRSTGVRTARKRLGSFGAVFPSQERTCGAAVLDRSVNLRRGLCRDSVLTIHGADRQCCRRIDGGPTPVLKIT